MWLRKSSLFILFSFLTIFGNLFNLIIPVPQVQAAHTFDTKLRITGSTSPVTANYTAAAGSTVLVLGIVTGGSVARAGGAPTYNGVALTQADSTRKAASNPETNVELFYLLDPPTGSALSISIPNTGTRSLFVEASTYKAQSGYISQLDVANGGSGTSTNPSVSVTTTTNGDTIVAVVGSGAQTWAPSARSGTQLNDNDDGAFGDGNQYLLQTNAGAQAMSWTFGTSDDWAEVVAAFKEVIKTTTLANGASEPSNVTIAPGASATDIDNFTFATNGSTDTITAATVTLGPANAFNNVAQVDITDTSNVAKCTAATNPASNTVSMTGCSMAVTTAATTYKIRITPKSHANMPAVPGATYATTATITGWTGSNATHSGSDSGSATVTIDNTSPSNVTSATATGGVEQVSLAWTNPADSDFSQVVVLRRSGTAVGDTPTEGSAYSVGNTIGSSTVACVTSGVSCTDSSLTGGTAYHYKMFAQDSNGNYSQTGVIPSGSPVTPTALVISVTVTDGTVAYGVLSPSGSSNTTSGGLNDTQVALNNGTVAEDFTIKTSVATGGTGWTLGSAIGSNIFVHEFSTNSGSNWTKFITADSYQTLVDNVDVNSSQNFDLRLTAPSSSTDAVQKTITITVQAVQH
jgi:hypothetical protein